MSADEFSADVDALKRSGVNLNAVADWAADLSKSCDRLGAEGLHALGDPDDQIGGALHDTFLKTMQFAGRALAGLKGLTEGHADNVAAAGTTIGGVAGTAVEVAGGGRHG